MSGIPTARQPVVDRGGLAAVVWRKFFETRTGEEVRGGIPVVRLRTRFLGWADAAPTAGDWTQGSLVLNGSAAIGQPWGWICTVSGAPGTWRALANVA